MDSQFHFIWGLPSRTASGIFCWGTGRSSAGYVCTILRSGVSGDRKRPFRYFPGQYADSSELLRSRNIIIR